MVSRFENWIGDVEVNLIMNFDIIYQEKDKIDSGDRNPEYLVLK